MSEAAKKTAIRAALLDHYAASSQLRDLPWRRAGGRKDGYAIWICEIMAQQTQIATVVRYWTAWMEKFPSVAALAAAPLDDVLASWAGLGYYARARSLHRAAKLVVEQHGGEVPADPEALLALPGIGRYTAGAIASIAFARRAAAVDGNVSRVLARVFAIGEDVRSPAGLRRLWSLAEELVPERQAGDFNQALFDVGATVCTPRAPTCLTCPLARVCEARKTGQQDLLPRLERKTKVKHVDVDAALVVREGAWLVARRVPSGLYGGLWELPTLAALGARPASAPLAEHVHQLSHRTMHHRVYRAEVDALAAPAAPYDAFRFVAPAELAGLGVSSATRSLVKALAAIEHPSETPCTRKKRPAPSSRKASRRSSPA